MRERPLGYEHVVFGGERTGAATGDDTEARGRTRGVGSASTSVVVQSESLAVALPVDARDGLSPSWIQRALQSIEAPTGAGAPGHAEGVGGLASLQLAVVDSDGSLVFYEVATGMQAP